MLRLSRLAADLDFRRREASGVPGLLATLEIAQRELAAVDGESPNGVILRITREQTS